MTPAQTPPTKDPSRKRWVLLPWNTAPAHGNAWVCPQCDWECLNGQGATIHALMTGHTTPSERPARNLDDSIALLVRIFGETPAHEAHAILPPGTCWVCPDCQAWSAWTSNARAHQKASGHANPVLAETREYVHEGRVIRAPLWERPNGQHSGRVHVFTDDACVSEARTGDLPHIKAHKRPKLNGMSSLHTVAGVYCGLMPTNHAEAIAARVNGWDALMHRNAELEEECTRLRFENEALTLHVEAEREERRALQKGVRDFAKGDRPEPNEFATRGEREACGL